MGRQVPVPHAGKWAIVCVAVITRLRPLGSGCAWRLLTDSCCSPAFFAQ